MTSKLKLAIEILERNIRNNERQCDHKKYVRTESEIERYHEENEAATEAISILTSEMKYEG